MAPDTLLDKGSRTILTEESVSGVPVQPMSPTAPRFAVSQITTQPWSFQQDVYAYAGLGVAMELWEAKMQSSGLNADDVSAMLASTGLHICSYQPDLKSIFRNKSQAFSPDPFERARIIGQTFKRLSSIQMSVPVITNTGASLDGNEPYVWDTCVRIYKELAKMAADYGLKLTVEPLGPSLMNRSTIISRLSDALNLIDAVSEPNLYTCVDLYNLHTDTSLHQSILSAGDRIAVVHAADWLRPRSFHDRHAIGDGVIDFSSPLSALRQSGYDGYYVLEIFSDGVEGSLWHDNPCAVITKSQTVLNQIYADLPSFMS